MSLPMQHISQRPDGFARGLAAAANLKMVEDKLREEKRRAAAANGFAAYAKQALEASPFSDDDVRCWPMPWSGFDDGENSLQYAL